MTRVLHWNGRDVPAELAELPPGDYVVTPANDTTLADNPLVRFLETMTPEDEAFLEGLAALDAADDPV